MRSMQINRKSLPGVLKKPTQVYLKVRLPMKCNTGTALNGKLFHPAFKGNSYQLAMECLFGSLLPALRY